MDVSNLQNENGFVTEQEIEYRIDKQGVPKDNILSFGSKHGSSFWELRVLSKNRVYRYSLTKIYVHNPEVYEFVSGKIRRYAETRGYVFECDPWGELNA